MWQKNIDLIALTRYSVAVEKEITQQNTAMPDFRLWLQKEFTDRCKRNPRYSLRAFAQLLKMDASSISQIFSGKRKASKKVISQACGTLSANSELQNYFIQKSKENFKYASLGKAKIIEPTFELLAQDAFAFISDWYHFALLELINVEGFNQNPSWCAKSLGITKTEAQIAIERLIRLGLFRYENKKLVRTNKLITNFSQGMTSPAHKNIQRKILELALAAIDNTPTEAKDITAMTMAIDTKKIPEARKLISKFRREMSTYLEDGPQVQVYNLAIQLYPISKTINKEEKNAN